MKSNSQCATCHAAASVTCPWKMFTVVDGEREYNGKTCGVGICGKHGVEVKGKRLCSWHAMKANEMGLT